MRKFICVVCFGTFFGCQNSQPHSSYSPEELARVGQAGERHRQEQEAEQDARDKPLADCLPIPLDASVNGLYTVRERLHRIGAHVVDGRTVVDQNGKVIYTRPEGFDERKDAVGGEWIKILMALEKYSSTPALAPPQ
jgi:hypothetical protein